MDEVDGLIIRAISNLGCSLENVSSLKEISTEHLIEGLVRCLWHVNPRHAPESYKLPPNMTARFRMATGIADAVKDAGYREDIGYQTLLYGSEAEIRRIFIFLIERLPKESAVTSDKELSPLEIVKLNAAEEIREALSAPWVPWFCRRLRYQWDGRFWRPPDGEEDIHFHSYPDPFNSDGALSDSVPWKDLPASIIEKTALDSQKKQKNISFSLDLKEIREVLNAKEFEGRSSRKKVKPRLLPKPKLLPKPNVADSEEKVDPSAAPEGSQEEQKEIAEFERLRTEVLTLNTDVDQAVAILAKRKQTAKQLQIETEKLWKSEYTKGDESEITEVKKLSSLLENPVASIEKLQSFLEKTDGRLAHLENQFAQHFLPLQQELADLRQGASHLDESEHLLLETREMKSKAEEQNAEVDTKQAFLLQLQRELEIMNKGLNRSAYTRRILEIVASVRKQREEIDRTLTETRMVQKDINMLTGKLERTFSATDELLFQDAKMDECSRRVYRLVVNLHEKCSEMVKSVEETGHICREIQDLQDSIETESQKSTDANLERLVNDYCEVKQENDNLSERLKLLHSALQ